MESPKKNGVYVTDRALDNNKLSWKEKYVASLIENLNEGENICFASKEYIACKLRRAEGVAKNVVNGLVKKGEVWKEPVMRKGKTRRILYLKGMPPYTDEELAKHKLYRVKSNPKESGNYLDSQRGVKMSRHVLTPLKSSRKSTRNEPPIRSIEEDTNLQLANARESDEMNFSTKVKDKEQNNGAAAFETFWAAWPKRVAKEAARKAFERLSPDPERDGVATLPELHVIILAAIKKQKLWREQANGNFRPEWAHPATWLNGFRWTDVVETTEAASEVKPYTLEQLQAERIAEQAEKERKEREYNAEP